MTKRKAKTTKAKSRSLKPTTLTVSGLMGNECKPDGVVGGTSPKAFEQAKANDPAPKIYSGAEVSEMLATVWDEARANVHRDRVQQFLTAVDAVEGRDQGVRTTVRPVQCGCPHGAARSIALILRKHGIS